MKKLQAYGRKMLTFFMVHFTLVAFYAMTAPWKSNPQEILVPILAAMILNAGIYIGGNVFDTLVKSKNFHPELVDK